jgi:hypothetical protein
MTEPDLPEVPAKPHQAAVLPDVSDEPFPPASSTRPDGWRRGSWSRILVEVALITAGVLLALLVDEWRERAEHRQLAEDTLRRIRTEFRTNRAAVAGVKDKHVAYLKRISDYFSADAAARASMPYPSLPTDPAFLEYTAWDLAIATQALGYLDPDVAQATAHVYAVQRQLDAATRDATHVMYLHAGNADPTPLTRSLAVYFGDCTIIEPRLLALYDEVLPRLDAAIGARP